MDLEKIIFIILALAFSIVSMFLKSKKQKKSLAESEQSDRDSQYEPEPLAILDAHDFVKQFNVVHLQENSNIYPKNEKKKQKPPKIKKENTQLENPKISLQNTDLENEICLLEEFEGSELQKAFLFSEIFKNTRY